MRRRDAPRWVASPLATPRSVPIRYGCAPRRPIGGKPIFRVSVLAMSATSPNAARKKARARAAGLLDAEDAERRKREADRRRRILDHVADIAGNDVKIAELTAQIDDLRADTIRRVAAIVGDNVSEDHAGAMTGRDLREVKAAVKAKTASAGQASARQQPAPAKRKAAPEQPIAA